MLGDQLSPFLVLGFFLRSVSYGGRDGARGGWRLLGFGRDGTPRFLWFLPGDGTAALDLGAHGGSELAELFGLFFGEVGGFEGVVLEVEEFPRAVGAIFEELPGAASDGPRGVAHVALVSFAAGEEGVAREGGLFAGF